MKLDYIYHSGFAIEADGVTVIIDYYKDSSETEYNKVSFMTICWEDPENYMYSLPIFTPTTLIAKFFYGRSSVRIFTTSSPRTS